MENEMATLKKEYHFVAYPSKDGQEHTLTLDVEGKRKAKVLAEVLKDNGIAYVVKETKLSEKEVNL